ncbi:MAG: ketol-acid reductoisomerase [Thermoprotei archaeon]
MAYSRLVTRLEDRESCWASIRGKQVVVMGYGNQGRSQSLNMRDSGLSVIVGNRSDEYADRARSEGFPVLDIAEAARRADILFALIPDEVQPEVFREEVTPNLRDGCTVVFASGYNYYYGTVTLPEQCNVVMLAPRMIGFGVRKRYLEGRGFPVLVAVGKDYTGDAEKQLLGLADAVGVFRRGGVAVRSSFREETLLDLLSEHTWAGALLYLFRAYYEVATGFGASPEAVILELYASGELEEIAGSIASEGLFKQLKNHSHTSQYGQLTRGPLFADNNTKELMRELGLEILDGTFAKEWSLEQLSGLTHFKKLYELALQHPMEKEEEKLYEILSGKEEK